VHLVTTGIRQDPGWGCAARIENPAVLALMEIHHASHVNPAPAHSPILATSML